MNQTSLVGRPLYHLTKSILSFAEKRGVWSGPLMSSSPELARLWGAPPTSTGMGVDETSAFTYSVFWACVNNISTDIGSFPLNLYKAEDDGGKTLLRNHPLFPLLHDAPNPEMTAFTFRGLLTSNALTWGMGYAEKVRDGAGRIAQLWPITPNRVQVKRESRAPYRIYYEVSREDGSIDRLSADQMFVLPGSTVDGIYGRNIVSMARESIGLGLAAERFGGTFYGNGSTFGGVFEHPGRMTELAVKNFRDSINTQHQGVDRAHKFLVVEEGMKFQRLTVDQNAAQFVETRQHQIEETCRWFRMPPHKVQHLIRTSYNSVEQMNIEYSTDTLTPWCVRWEQEVLRQLIAPSERRIQFVKHNMDSKLRGDTASRYEAYTKGIQNGFLSADDVREKEDLNPLPDGAGKKYFIQSNTQPLNRVDEIIDKQVAPDPTPAPAPTPPDPTPTDGAARAIEAFQAQIDALTAKSDALLERAAAAETRATTSDTEKAEKAAEAQAALDLAAECQRQIQALTVLKDDAVADVARVTEAERQSKQFAAELEAAAEATTKARLEAEAEKDAEIAALRSTAAEVEARWMTEQAAWRTEQQRVAEEAAELARALAATQDASEQVKTEAAAEATRLTSELEAIAARAAQAERDREVMAQTAMAADLALTKLQADLAAADLLYAETAKTLGNERTALDAARSQLEHLQATIAETQAEIARLAAERTAFETDAITAAQAADEAHRKTAESTAQLAKATADADAARARLDVETARVHAEQAEKAALAATMEAQRKAHADHLQALLPARREQAKDQVSRVVRVETDRARRNQGTPAKIKAWAEAFYLQLEDRYVEALRTLVSEHLVFIGSTEDVDAYTRTLVAPQLLHAVTQIRTVADGDPEDFAVSLDRILVKWEQDRPAAIADRLFQEEMTYVRSL